MKVYWKAEFFIMMKVFFFGSGLWCVQVLQTVRKEYWLKLQLPHLSKCFSFNCQTSFSRVHRVWGSPAVVTLISWWSFILWSIMLAVWSAENRSACNYYMMSRSWNKYSWLQTFWECAQDHGLNENNTCYHSINSKCFFLHTDRKSVV